MTFDGRSGCRPAPAPTTPAAPRAPAGSPQESRSAQSTWHAPDIAAPAYPIATLRHLDRRVWLHLASGHTIEGKLGRDPRSKRLMWWEWRESLSEYVILEPWLQPGTVSASRSSRQPLAWAPVVPMFWPEPLPEPMIGPRASTPVPVPEAEPPAPPEDAGWPYPDLALGELTPARCAREAEARVLRAFRTSDAQPKVGNGESTYAADLPRELVDAARRSAAMERLAEALGKGVPLDSEIGAVRAPWSPTRRDLGDWVHALGWLSGIERKHRRLLKLRAANPPWSWRQIAELRFAGSSGAEVRAEYTRACKALFEVARVAPIKGER